jgi:predicted RNA-binding protein with RPS1 domain
MTEEHIDEAMDSFIKMIEEACKLNEDALVKVNEIEHKMQKSINELPYNLVQLAWSRVEQVINQKAN